MQNNTKGSNFSQFFGIISVILSVVGGFFLVLSGITCIISLVIAIPFGIVAVFLAIMGIIFGRIGVSQAKKNNSSLLVPNTGVILGTGVISVVFIGFLVVLFMISYALFR
ncbi:hypothetical protein [Flavobacterium piscisymbiosum]|uniref:DUF4190 domain-containing protein n=1 Tax=Flavobacterium piscisymbiosum TaxID=2893753 RepID=A0ABS8MGG7_9FLAO|nr:hypothetical protein [Flavobacterium sp. F-30]MCC9064051.1 hypothetical protein [Flavobacterium sp. F-30]